MYARLTLCLCLKINHLYSFVIYLVASEDLCTNVPSASGQPSASNVPSASASGQPSASNVPSASASGQPSASNIPSASAVPSASASGQPSASNVPSASASGQPSASNVPSASPPWGTQPRQHTHPPPTRLSHLSHWLKRVAHVVLCCCAPMGDDMAQ